MRPAPTRPTTRTGWSGSARASTTSRTDAELRMNRAFQATLVGLALLLASCGGGQLTAGIEGSGAPVTTVGSITGFGSILVNGVEYATAGAQVGIDGQAGTEAQLSVGDVVTVVGTVNADGKTGTASQVTFEGNVAGTVDQVNVPTQTLVVLGQTVLVTASTVFDANMSPADITGVKPGASIEVSGFANSFGQLVASHIQLLPAAGTLRVEGVVQALNTTAHTFQVNALLVDYSAVTPSGTLADGSIVGVEGSGFSASGALQAAAVEVAPAAGGTPNSQGEVEGIITSFTSNADFMINGLHVTTDASTQFTLNGATLGVNARVAVEGSFDSSGNLVAATLEALPEGAALVRGVVQALLPASGTLTVLGVTVTTDPRTKRSEEHTSELQSRVDLVCRLLLEKKKTMKVELDVVPVRQQARECVKPGALGRRCDDLLGLCIPPRHGDDGPDGDLLDFGVADTRD